LRRVDGRPRFAPASQRQDAQCHYAGD
jgi:hypothetical protein